MVQLPRKKIGGSLKKFNKKLSEDLAIPLTVYAPTEFKTGVQTKLAQAYSW